MARFAALGLVLGLLGCGSSGAGFTSPASSRARASEIAAGRAPSDAADEQSRSYPIDAAGDALEDALGRVFEGSDVSQLPPVDASSSDVQTARDAELDAGAGDVVDDASSRPACPPGWVWIDGRGCVCPPPMCN